MHLWSTYSADPSPKLSVDNKKKIFKLKIKLKKTN